MKKLFVPCLAKIVSADLPVHCTKSEIIGDWVVHVSADSSTVDLFKTYEFCTHQAPNKVQIIDSLF